MNRNELATIHILKKDAGLDDASYRALLFRIAGVYSAKDLQNRDQYYKVTAALRGDKPVVFKKPEPKFNWAAQFSKPVRPWKFLVPTERQWNHFGELITIMDERFNISLVAIHNADGSKQFKFRKRS